MFIYFEPSIAFFTYGLAFIISILPVSLVKRIPNLVLSIVDLIAIGAGELIRKQYLTTFFYFIISLVSIFLVSFSKFYFIHSDTFLKEDQISFIASGIIVAGAVIFTLIHSLNRGEEMERENRIEFNAQVEKNYQDAAYQTLGIHLSNSFTSPIQYSESAGSFRPSVNQIGETLEEQDKLDRQWQEEVEHIHREQEDWERQEEDHRQQEESFRSFEDD